MKADTICSYCISNCMTKEAQQNHCCIFKGLRQSDLKKICHENIFIGVMNAKKNQFLCYIVEPSNNNLFCMINFNTNISCFYKFTKVYVHLELMFMVPNQL